MQTRDKSILIFDILKKYYQFMLFIKDKIANKTIKYFKNTSKEDN